MKAVLSLFVLIVSQAFAYNTHYIPVEFGKYNVVQAESKKLINPRSISLIVDVNSTTGNAPIVEVFNRYSKSCNHKGTHLMFSGYDYATRTYKKTFEIKIEKDPSASCLVDIYASASAQDTKSPARVTILENK